MENEFIKIPNSIVRNSEITNDAKLAYTILKLQIGEHRKRGYVPLNLASLTLVAGYAVRTVNTNKIKYAMQELINLNLVRIYEDFNLTEKLNVEDLKPNTNFFVKMSNDYPYSNNFLNSFTSEQVDKDIIEYGIDFTLLYVEDLVKLIGLDVKANKANLLSQYLVVTSRAIVGDKSNRYSLETINKIMKYANLSNKTAQSYSDLLFTKKLLFKATMRQISSDGVIKNHNIYTRWGDRFHAGFAMMDDEFLKSTVLHKIGNKTIDEVGRKRYFSQVKKEFSMAS